MPAEGIKLLRHEDILSFDEITDVARVATGMGIRKVRLTGGEPLVRRGITDLVKMIASIPGIEDFSMTTNGTLLDKFAGPLKEAGLQRINVSLDTLDPAKYKKITRGGILENVLTGLKKAEEAGFSPVKINCVAGEFTDESDALQMKQFGKENNYEVRFIRQMNLAAGEFYIVDGGTGGNCSMCNRLRLTSNGIIKPCLFNAAGYSVRELGAKEAILLAVDNKPGSGTFNLEEEFCRIGG
jgi:cyclic pyranopterin phosphate synthase